MKKLLLLLFSVASLPLMSLDPDVRISQQGNGTYVSLPELKFPTIKIQECSQCGKEAFNVCDVCRFTYYCSAKCKRSDQSRHASICEDMQKILHGDVESIEVLVAALFEKAMRNNSRDMFVEGLIWLDIMLIRLSQDVACSKAPSTQSAVGFEKDRWYPIIMNLIGGEQYCTKKKFIDASNHAEVQAFLWVEDKTKRKELVSPVGIRRYGMDAFFSAQVDLDTEFIPQDQWHEKRLQVLRAQRKKMEARGLLVPEGWYKNFFFWFISLAVIACFFAVWFILRKMRK